jgi:hypothetical protein
MPAITLPLVKYHQFQDVSNNCGPFTIAIVVNALRDQELLHGKEVAREMNRPRLRWLGPLPWPVIRRIPDNATFPWGMVDELRRHGVKARWRFGATTADLHRALSENRVAMPIIGEIVNPRLSSRLWAHVKPLSRYEPEAGYSFVDPSQQQAGEWPDENFERLWANWGRLLVETL